MVKNMKSDIMKLLITLVVVMLLSVCVYAGGGGSSSEPTPDPVPTPPKVDPGVVFTANLGEGTPYGPSHPDYEYYQDKNLGYPTLRDIQSPVDLDVSPILGSDEDCDSQFGVSRDSESYQCDDQTEPETPDEPHPLWSFREDAMIRWGEHCDQQNFAGRFCSLRMGAGYVGELACDNYQIDESGCYPLFADIASAECGNGVLDAGEECDFAIAGTEDCSLECTSYNTDCTLVESIEEACFCENGGTGANKYLSYEIDMNREDVSNRLSGVQTNGCCGDEDGEYLVKMDDLNIVLPDNPFDENTYGIFRDDGVYACCDQDTDCNYMGRCINHGEVVAENPRYACNYGNLVEALDIDYERTETVYKQATRGTNGRFVTQKTPTEFISNSADSMNNLIACNNDVSVLTELSEPFGAYFEAGRTSDNDDLFVPQLWKSVTNCEGGQVNVKLLDVASNSYMTTSPVTFVYFLYDFELAGNGNEFGSFDVQKKYKELTFGEFGATGNSYVMSNILGTYFTLVAVTENGYVGVDPKVRVNYDGVTEIELAMVRSNACVGCIDYTTGACSPTRCSGVGIEGFECDYPSEIYDSDSGINACDSRAPGTMVEAAGNVYSCCSDFDGSKWLIGKAVPRVKASIDCDADDLVTKDYVLTWNNQPIKLVVAVCSENE